MLGSTYLRPALLIVSAALLAPGFVAAQDADTREVQSYVLTDAGLSRYALATKKLAALPRPAGACEDGDSGSASLSDMVAKLDAAPGARNAIQSAGMTTREYVVFSMSLLHNGLAAWAASQPGGKLPPGASKANVDFYNQHKAELEKLSGPRAGDECAEDARDSEDPPE
jgi:hypothetical protein